jgi:exodeoxyribonuclease VII large subunit
MKAPLVLTIGQLNAYVKSLLDGDDNLNHVYVSAEISNFTNHYRTGHFYFSLKDENAVIRAVMFRSSAQRLKFLPQDGMRVIVRGRVSLYERDGQYQLYVDDLQPDGVGALNLAYEQLKEKLSKEGLFAPERKKTLPRYPMRVGVVTSPTGAAVILSMCSPGDFRLRKLFYSLFRCKEQMHRGRSLMLSGCLMKRRRRMF